jgi:predicted deacylase
LRAYQLIEGEVKTQTLPCVEGDIITSVRAKQGGFVLCHVNLLEKVRQGEHIATQYNSFGDIIDEYYSPADGVVISHNVESVRAPGSLVVRLIS